MLKYIVHYGELGLKGQNRAQFEKRLARNIRAVLTDLSAVRTQRFRSHLLLELENDEGAAEVERRLQRVFGIAYFARAMWVPQEWEAMVAATEELARACITSETRFKIDARRGDKRFPLTSVDINRELGARVVALTGAPVDLHSPEVAIRVQVYEDGVYLFVRRIPGARGLPVGVSGRVLTLLSGGIDSPVAAHLMLKRGCTMDFLHFHVLPTAEQVRSSKVVALARQVLEPHRLPAILYMAPAHPFQLAMMDKDSRVEVVAFRRFVMRVGETLARRRRARALVTGDNLGQVASQTLQNLAVISRAAEMPILRPLVGFDKDEIVALAQQIDTYERSIEAYKDPCSLHAHNPATKARLHRVLELEAQLDIEGLVQETLEQIEEIWIDW